LYKTSTVVKPAATLTLAMFGILTQVVNDIEYAANFFTDASTFAKSGAETTTWASTNQNSNGTLGLAQVDKLTS
jgi:hypothetical protein